MFESGHIAACFRLAFVSVIRCMILQDSVHKMTDLYPSFTDRRDNMLISHSLLTILQPHYYFAILIKN